MLNKFVTAVADSSAMLIMAAGMAMCTRDRHDKANGVRYSIRLHKPSGSEIIFLSFVEWILA